jgi:hypothetical protein
MTRAIVLHETGGPEKLLWEAHAALESRATTGAVILTVGGQT